MNAPLVEELTPLPDSVECCERLSALPFRLFLDSAAVGARLGRYSFLTADPAAVVLSKGARTECLNLIEGTRGAVEGDALDVIGRLLAPHFADPIADLPPFQGGAAGYLAYDWGRVLERLPAPRYEDLALPDVAFGIYDWVIAWDHEQSRAWLISTGLPETDATARASRAASPGGRRQGRAGWPRPGRSGRSDRHERHGAPETPPAGTVPCRGRRLVGRAARACDRHTRIADTSTPSPACASTSSPAISFRPTSRSVSKRSSASRHGSCTVAFACATRRRSPPTSTFRTASSSAPHRSVSFASKPMGASRHDRSRGPGRAALARSTTRRSAWLCR